MIRQILAPLHPDGWKFVAIGAVGDADSVPDVAARRGGWR